MKPSSSDSEIVERSCESGESTSTELLQVLAIDCCSTLVIDEFKSEFEKFKSDPEKSNSDNHEKSPFDVKQSKAESEECEPNLTESECDPEYSDCVESSEDHEQSPDITIHK